MFLISGDFEQVFTKRRHERSNITTTHPHQLRAEQITTGREPWERVSTNGIAETFVTWSQRGGTGLLPEHIRTFCVRGSGWESGSYE